MAARVHQITPSEESSFSVAGHRQPFSLYCNTANQSPDPSQLSQVQPQAIRARITGLSPKPGRATGVPKPCKKSPSTPRMVLASFWACPSCTGSSSIAIRSNSTESFNHQPMTFESSNGPDGVCTPEGNSVRACSHVYRSVCARFQCIRIYQNIRSFSESTIQQPLFPST